MPKTDDLFSMRKSLDQICTIPDSIISVYSLEKHIWADGNAPAARRERCPELQTVEEFQIDPVRPFLNDILRNMAAPYRPERRDNPIGQGYWIQAEFGSGKSHLLCFLAALALGGSDAWAIVDRKEKAAARGKRESIYRFWEEGLEGKNAGVQKGIFVIARTLVGVGSGTVGLQTGGQRLTEYILEAAKDQLLLETGKNLSLYPAELLADRFISEDLDLYRPKLKKFLRDPEFFDEDEWEDVDDFIRDIQQNESPEYKRSRGNKLWRFYTEYLKVQPHIVAEPEAVLKHLVETVLAEGYSGVLLILDEISEFMKTRNDNERSDDLKTLLVLSNRLAKVYNLPIWVVCAAQQAIQQRMGMANIIADDRLKLVRLLEKDTDYYQIVLARVREIKEPGAVGSYFLHYKRGFSWPNHIGETEFARFFPFHKPALEVLLGISYELTTARAAIQVMHPVLKHQMARHSKEIIRLWELFDETVKYEEEPSGVQAGIVAIRTNRPDEYAAFVNSTRQLDSLTKGYLKVHRDKAIRTVQTLFLYYLSRTRQQGLLPEEIANSVLIERDADAHPDENIQHYETISDHLNRELRQVGQTLDTESRPRFRFDPVHTSIDPRVEFRKARDEAESNEAMRREAWNHLLALDEWPVRTRQMVIDLSGGTRSMFRDIAPFVGIWEDRLSARHGAQNLEMVWQGRQIEGWIGMRDFARMAADNQPLQPIDSDATDLDFAVYVGTRHVAPDIITKLLALRRDGRILLWAPDELTADEQDRLLDFAAYRKLVAAWEGKDSEDAVAVINWVSQSLQTDLGRIVKIVDSSYARGRFDAVNHSQIPFHVAGGLSSVLSPLIDRVLTSAYESRDIRFDPPFTFRKEEGVKVINGIVRSGHIPGGEKPNQNISAARNFGFGLKIMKRGAEGILDTSDNPYVQDMWSFIDDKLPDNQPGQTMNIETIYKNFMGIGGPKDYGLTRRMVQIYLLCLVQQGKVRVAINAKSGLQAPFLDYSNLAGVDFSVKVLDAMTETQKLAKPENWDVLRPYAEKLLAKEIPPTHDDAVISGYRTELRELFASESESSRQMVSRATSLSETLGTPVPYKQELEQVARLFAADLGGGDDIHLLLYALKDAFGYRAFDEETADPSEADDLANRLRNYRDVERFLSYDKDLRAAHIYCSQDLPDLPELRDIRRLQQQVSSRLADLRTYVDSEVKLKTELLGQTPPGPGETGTVGVLIREYTEAYTVMHDRVVESAEQSRKTNEGVLHGEAMQALQGLEKITALQPAVSPELEHLLQALGNRLFVCTEPSRTSVVEWLKTAPIHDCNLSFQNAHAHLETAEQAAVEAQRLLDDTLNRKVEVLLHPTIRERLEQGRSEPLIAGLLACSTVAEARVYMTETLLSDPAAVETINRYLKQIVVRQVRLVDFKPSTPTIEQGQIVDLALEFQRFLEEQIAGVGEDDDILPMLQIE